MSRLDSMELLAFFLAAKPGLDVICDEHNKVVLKCGQEELLLPCEVDNVIFRANKGMESVCQRLTYYIHCEQMSTCCEDQETVWLYGGLRKFLGSERFKQLLGMIEGQFKISHSH